MAVIDTGIDYTHPDLRGSMWVNPHEIPGNGMDDDGNGIVDEAPKKKLLGDGMFSVHQSLYHQETNIDAKNNQIRKQIKSSKAHHFWYVSLKFRGCIPFFEWFIVQ